MWANEEVASFLGWLRDHNRATGRATGFYGLEIYSLWESLDTVLDYLKAEHPDALETARQAVRCFEPFGDDMRKYARSAGMVPSSCEKQVVDLLLELRTNPVRFSDDPEGSFDARQNAEVLAGAEHYYRSMLGADGDAWNIRDNHMADTLERLMDHHGPGAKAVVWAHNTHVGDARATPMASDGMVSLGQLIRERRAGDGVVLVGFGGHCGTVVAADSWGETLRRKTIPEAPEGSHEDLLHRAVGKPSLLVFPANRRGPWLSSRRRHRAIGAVYSPGYERFGTWVPTVMGDRYDAFFFFEDTRALTPLHPEEPQREANQTYPWSA